MLNTDLAIQLVLNGQKCGLYIFGVDREPDLVSSTVMPDFQLFTQMFSLYHIGCLATLRYEQVHVFAFSKRSPGPVDCLLLSMRWRLAGLKLVSWVQV